MERAINHKRPGWLLPLRLASYVILFVVVVFWMDYPHYLRVPFILYSIATLAVAVLFGLHRRYPVNSARTVTVALQFLFEIAIETGIVYTTGNVNSPFFALFLLTIVSAALAYNLIGTLIVASLASLGDVFIIWLGIEFSDIPGESGLRGLDALLQAQDSIFYSVFLHLLIFYLIAFIAGFLAERLRIRDRQLADASAALRMARLETDDILRHLNSGLLTVDQDGRLIYFNRAAERILGYSEGDVRGMLCNDVFAQRMPQLAEAVMDGIENNTQYPRKEISILNAHRIKTPLGLATSRLQGEEGRLRGVIAIFSDLTDAKRLEEKVRAADRLAAVGELSASIAHEIRNPLAAISGSVEVLKGELQVAGENARLMDLIVKESDRLSKITTEFLQYARIDRPTMAKVELCHLVQDIIQVVYHHPSYHENIKISFQTNESIVYVVGDEGLIKQLLLNIAVNACEAMDAQPHELEFSLERPEERNQVLIRVTDDGPGITRTNLARIYQPFFSTKKEGTGLGLAVVHRICAALKIRSQVDSIPGRGTSFSFVLRPYGCLVLDDTTEVLLVPSEQPVESV
ncbi:MAG TPA: ATP-binding protein [candidate division Zixibacteria bacterium]|nr:ATP-binding protein [candidate division Zixibacteria bacterium]